MKCRTCFLRLSVAALIIAISCSGRTQSSGSAESSYCLYNILPLRSGCEKQSAADAVEYMRRTGCDIVLYSLALHPEGFPAIEKAKKYIASYRELKRELEGSGVRLGILVQSILGHWPRVDKKVEAWQRSININGKAVRFCPDDPGFAAYIEQVFTMLAETKPSFILTDDDVRAYSHDAECFCPKHIAEFNRRRGTSYAEDEVRKRVKAAKQNDPDYVAFFAIQREMMNRLVKRMRSAIDAVDPSIPAGICVSGQETFLVAPMAKAIAAHGQRPVMRCSDGSYAERYTTRLHQIVFRTLGFNEYYEDSGIDILSEADTCPHNLWSKSALSFFTHMTLSAFAGMKGAKVWYVNGRKVGGPVAHEYTDVLADNRGYLDAVASAVAETEFCGVAVPCFSHFPNWHLGRDKTEKFDTGESFAQKVLIPFGIPFRMEKDFASDSVFLISNAAEVKRFTDSELRTIFSRRVLVTGEAAIALTLRGCSDLTGVNAERKDFLFNREMSADGKQSYAFAPSSHAPFFVADEKSEILTSLMFSPYPGSEELEKVSPATVLYRNRLGGRVITMAYHNNMYGLYQYSEARKSYVTGLIDILNGLPVQNICGLNQDIMTLARTGRDGSSLVLTVNLSTEPVHRMKLRVFDVKSVEILSPNGRFVSVPFEHDGEWVSFGCPLVCCQAAVARLR
ncbi:MAG: hypothetical protein IKJ37_16590 [Kiritimatiellae bacterium]|nr:hypothetical protein [Kiritimatiellia bacterium]